MGSEVIGSVKWARENLNPREMNALGEILSSALISYLDLITSDTRLDKLIEYGKAVAEIGEAIQELDGYKMSANGQSLDSVLVDQNPED